MKLKSPKEIKKASQMSILVNYKINDTLWDMKRHSNIHDHSQFQRTNPLKTKPSTSQMFCFRKLIVS